MITIIKKWRTYEESRAQEYAFIEKSIYRVIDRIECDACGQIVKGEREDASPITYSISGTWNDVFLHYKCTNCGKKITLCVDFYTEDEDIPAGYLYHTTDKNWYLWKLALKSCNIKRKFTDYFNIF